MAPETGGAPATMPEHPPSAAPEPVHATRHDARDDDDSALSEPVLTAEELRALLQEQPSFPYGDGES